MKTSICPYPGLRPFTEEESIFFKGRDLHIRQIVKMLEQNKMAFITGASGDGKSSIVYAGVIPYIRAGFSTAEYNSWVFCDFKPQRNPLESLAHSLAKQLKVPFDEVLDELECGFSGLINIYKKSGFYAADGDKNRGKNLLIVADQFEEVFTMNENFHNGIPSNEAYTAVNILLETVRLSISEQLPVYVIFTMRSDYISQCTVFRDLPEFIAYSQFFVPQLKRTEILQVIEQPALLAGGSVSSRLSEVLINNLTSGFDQLPVLQHTLNLLWKTADNGKETLDLIHLAKLAGISKDLLSDAEQSDFNRWYLQLPDYQKKYFEKPDLNNVLNAHAGTLYESAFDYYMQNADWADKTITPEESKLIVKTAFTSLTKIDDNRQVRNRSTMNLTEDANANARRLYYVALCNTLAMKAKNQYEDKSLNLRLAKTACEMSRKGGEESKNADLYDAMVFAMEQNKLISPLKFGDGEQKALSIDSDGTINTFGDDGSSCQYAVSPNGTIRQTGRITDFESKVPVENAIFAAPSLVISCGKDRKSYIIDLNRNTRTQLPCDDDYVVAASQSPDRKQCAVAYTYGKVVMMPLDGSATPYEKDFDGGLPYQTTEDEFDYPPLFIDDAELAGTCAIGPEWTVLLKSEWTYLLQRRKDADKKFGSAQIVGECKGLVILPDEFTLPEGLDFRPFEMFDFDDPKEIMNVYTVDDWARMEQAGAVFLPDAPYRYLELVDNSYPGGWYWTRSAPSDGWYRGVFITFYGEVHEERLGYGEGCAVRLVQML